MDSAPQEEFQNSLRKQMKNYLLQKPDMRDTRNWNIEEVDVVLSIFPSGSFHRLQLGTEAMYKGTQRVIILGFSEEMNEG